MPNHEVPDPSPREHLLGLLEAHIKLEEDAVLSYQKLAHTSNDRLTALLMRMVLQDEEHHHELMRRLLATASESPYWKAQGEELPVAGRGSGEEARQGRTLLERLAREERKNSRRFRRLAREDLERYGGLVSLLLELMAHDSRKHELVLRFLLRRLRTAEKASPRK